MILLLASIQMKVDEWFGIIIIALLDLLVTEMIPLDF